MRKRVFSWVVLAPLFLGAHDVESEELVVDLKNPQFIDGQLNTSEGGVIAGKNLRIQAQNISYHTTIVDGIPQRLVKASGDLFIVFKDKPFVADSITYDFVSGKGILDQGRTYVDLWYLGGKQILLNPDGSFEAQEAFITTSANRHAAWEFHSSSMKVNKKRTLSVKNLSLRLFKIPIFWMPTFKASLRFLKDPLIKYKVTWDKGIGPRFTARYQFLSSEKFDLYLRADARITSDSHKSIKGAFGGALESIYKDPEHRTQFLTRNFYANDKIVPEERGPHRYRFQGLFKHTDEQDKSMIYLSYDKLSDQTMISDFKSDDFVVNTEKRSYLYLARQEQDVLMRLSVQPCLNRFQSITEELPNLIVNLRSQDLGSSGLIANSDSSLSYLNYKYALGLQPYFEPYNAFRMQTLNQLYRPIHIKGFNLNPKVGVLGIYYNQGPVSKNLGQLSYHYGLEANLRAIGSSKGLRHVIEPYFTYNGYSKPWISSDNHYYFYLDDGLSKLNVIQTGIRQFVKGIKHTQVMADLFALSFCQGFNYPQMIAKYGANLECYFSRVFLKTYALYNVGAKHLDYINVHGAYTLSNDFALSLEYRNRGPYCWRKSDPTNYFLDVSRPNQELLTTPISDQRQTILGKIALRLSPRVNAQLAGHYGFGRKEEPSYKSTKVDFNFSIGGSWNLKIGYQHSPDNDRFTTSFYLSP
jgi:hypothetical protein